MSSVSLQSVNKVYGGHVAVRDLNLEIAEGEFVVLLGPSGCGKTTTLRMIAGFVDPSSGCIALGGKDVTELPPRQRDIGMVFHNYALFPHMKVRDNIAYGLHRRGVARKKADLRVDELLDTVKLTGYADHLPEELSGGQQQRVSLARAIAHTPKVLLMDEPLGALDMKLREQLQDEIHRIQKSLGVTTIFVTHDQHEAMALADRIVLMEGGAVHQQGTAAEIYLHPKSEFAAGFVGKCNLLQATYLGGGLARLAGGKKATVTDVGDSVRPGDGLRLSLRPEVLRVVPAREANGLEEAWLMACVTQRRFLGSIVHYRLRTTGGDALLAESRHLNLEVGAEVAVSWSPEYLTAFSDAGSRAQ